MSIPIEWIPAEPSLDAYGEVFSRFPFLKTIGNSLFISVSYTVITLISASMAAFALPKSVSAARTYCSSSTWPP